MLSFGTCVNEQDREFASVIAYGFWRRDRAKYFVLHTHGLGIPPRLGNRQRRRKEPSHHGAPFSQAPRQRASIYAGDGRDALAASQWLSERTPA